MPYSGFIQTRSSQSKDDVLGEEERGFLEPILAIVAEEDDTVAASFVCQLIKLSESQEFVRSASPELLSFYS